MVLFNLTRICITVNSICDLTLAAFLPFAMDASIFKDFLFCVPTTVLYIILHFLPKGENILFGDLYTFSRIAPLTLGMDSSVNS